MELTALLMAALLQVCAFGGGRDVVLRVLRPEWQQPSILLIDASGRAQAFEKAGEAAAEVEQRLKARQEVWIGPLQVNASAFAPMGHTVQEGMDPCVNLAVGSRLLAGIDEPTAEDVKASKKPWADYQAALARYFSADPATGQALAKRIVDEAVAKKPLPSFPAVPIGSGEYRQAFVRWSQAQATSMGRRAPLPPQP